LSLIKKYPTHPDTKEWITQFEQMLAPPKPAGAATPAAPGSAPVPGGVAPGAAVPQ